MCAATGYVLGQRVGKGIADRFRALGGLEYLFAVVGAALLAAGAAAHLEVAVLLVGVGALGAVSVARRAQRAR